MKSTQTQVNSTPPTMDLKNYSSVQSMFNLFERKPKIFEKPSRTEPDLALTIREILSKHSSVRQLPIMKDPIYDEGLSNLGIQKKTLDLTDLANLREANEAKINALNASLETSRKLKNQIEFDDRVGKEVQRRIDAEKEKAAKEAAKH
jgi:hypothetical protein